MVLIIIGVLLWSVVHLLPAAAPGVRGDLLGRLGEGGYKGLFSLLILLAIVLIVLGWRGTVPEPLYSPAYGLRTVSIGLMVIAFILIGASNQPVRIRHWIRHPQLTGLALWAFAHLLSNGDNKSVALFGGLLIWALIEIPLISRREGEWQKPELQGWRRDIIGVVVSLAIMAAFVWAHPWIAGVPVR